MLITTRAVAWAPTPQNNSQAPMGLGQQRQQQASAQIGFTMVSYGRAWGNHGPLHSTGVPRFYPLDPLYPQFWSFQKN